jgi:TPR repeat protein
LVLLFLTPLPFCFNLGLSYEKGKGVKQDDFKALKFYQKACDLNFGGGCSNLGLSYKEGKGVKPNTSSKSQALP